MGHVGRIFPALIVMQRWSSSSGIFIPRNPLPRLTATDEITPWTEDNAQASVIH